MKPESKWMAFILLFIFSGEAQVSRIHFSELSLSDLHTGSEIILIVERSGDKPLEHSVEIKKSGKTYPPFIFLSERFIVKEILKGKDLVKDRLIDVFPPNLSTDEHMHRLYVTEGVMKSPLFERYSPTEYKDNNKPFIIFLRTSGENGFAYSCINAVEGIGLKEKLIAEIKRSKHSAE